MDSGTTSGSTSMGTLSAFEDPGDRRPSDPVVDYPVHWVTEKTLFNRLKSEYAKYGNSAELNYLYGKMVLICRDWSFG